MKTFSVENTDPFFDFPITLDGTQYVLALQWNSRESRYYASLGTSDGAWLATGDAVVCVTPLFANFVGRVGMPPGVLFVQPSSDDDSPPQIGELSASGRCTLAYMEASEL